MALLFFEPQDGSKQFLPEKHLVEKIGGLLSVSVKKTAEKTYVVHQIRRFVLGNRICDSNGWLLHGRGERRVFIIFRPSAALTENLWECSML